MKIFLIGFMGSGKSTAGEKLAKKLGLDFIDMDSVIEQDQKKSIAEIFAEDGETYFRKLESELLAKLLNKENVVISTGGGVPCFFNNMELMNNHGITIYLKMSPGFLAARLNQKKRKRPLIKEKSKEELNEYIAGTLSQREPFYSRAKHIIPAENLKVSQLTKIVKKERG